MRWNLNDPRLDAALEAQGAPSVMRGSIDGGPPMTMMIVARSLAARVEMGRCAGLLVRVSRVRGVARDGSPESPETR